jgi:hypothetical protein
VLKGKVEAFDVKGIASLWTSRETGRAFNPGVHSNYRAKHAVFSHAPALVWREFDFPVNGFDEKPKVRRRFRSSDLCPEF